MIIDYYQEDRIDNNKKKYSSNLNLLHPTSHYHLISSAGGTEVARGTNGPSNFGRYRSLNVSIK